MAIKKLVSICSGFTISISFLTHNHHHNYKPLTRQKILAHTNSLYFNLKAIFRFIASLLEKLRIYIVSYNNTLIDCNLNYCSGWYLPLSRRPIQRIWGRGRCEGRGKVFGFAGSSGISWVRHLSHYFIALLSWDDLEKLQWNRLILTFSNHQSDNLFSTAGSGIRSHGDV